MIYTAGTQTVKGHRYQKIFDTEQIFDTGDSSDSSSCLRKSYSPTSKTPVRNVMSPNENLLSSHHEVKKEESEGTIIVYSLKNNVA